MADWFDGGGAGSHVDVAAMMDSKAPELLWDMVAFGALVALGQTSDGGALGVTVTVDGRWRREYFRDVEQLLEWLSEAVPAVRDACEARTASSVRRERPRRSRGL
jgi:hypothetical protein